MRHLVGQRAERQPAGADHDGHVGDGETIAADTERVGAALGGAENQRGFRRLIPEELTDAVSGLICKTSQVFRLSGRIGPDTIRDLGHPVAFREDDAMGARTRRRDDEEKEPEVEQQAEGSGRSPDHRFSTSCQSWCRRN